MSSPSAPPADQRSSAVAGGGGVHREFGVISRPDIAQAEGRLTAYVFFDTRKPIRLI